MNEKEALLQQLSDIKTLEPVGWWPPAPGWWVLAFLLVLALSLGIYFWLQHRKNTRYRKQALRILSNIETERPHVPPVETLEKIQALLKRTALTAYKHSRNNIAHLYGHDFFVFLQATVNHLPIRIDARWHNALYQPGLAAHTNFPMHLFLDFARYWIKQHQKLPVSELQHRLQLAKIHKPSSAQNTPANLNTLEVQSV